MIKVLVPILVLSLTACTSKKPEAPVEPEPTLAVDAPPSAPDIRGDEVTYQAGETTLKGYLAWDASKEGPRPGVVVVHEWWGHNDYVRRRARMLAQEGYTALALDMYGDGKLAEHPDDAQKFMMETVSKAEEANARFEAAVELLKAHATTDPDEVSAIGYCFGGAVVLHMARFGKDLDGVASFHGNLATETPAEPGAIKAKVLVLHGGADAFVPKEQVDAFKKEMEAAGADYTFIEYPGVSHSFTNPEATEIGKKFDMPVAYDAAADEKSWAELLKFLQGLYGA